MSSQPDGGAAGRPRSVLICHVESRLNRQAVAGWLASFTNLVGIVLIDEQGTQARNRVRHEVKRIGWARMLDVLAFRLYYGLFINRRDSRWMTAHLAEIARRYPVPVSTEVLRTRDPNSAEVSEFLRRLAPDLAVARCKRILKESVFAVPRHGTFVLHPDVCPEYRNAHGAFWALANDDLENVGLTLLKIDKGIDTGPVYGYFSYDLDEVNESHIIVMTRLLTDNFDQIRDRLLAAIAGSVPPIDTSGRRSAVWGQPWLTRYMQWKRAAKRRRHAGTGARIS